jgi:hypothetical protein
MQHCRYKFTHLCLLLQGLWNGTVPGLLLTIPYTAVQFVALQQCKEAAAKLGWGGEPLYMLGDQHGTHDGYVQQHGQIEEPQCLIETLSNGETNA